MDLATEIYLKKKALKFRYSEKATKFRKNFPLCLKFVFINVKTKMEIFSTLCVLLRISEL